MKNFLNMKSFYFVLIVLSSILAQVCYGDTTTSSVGKIQRIDLPDANGPESLDFDCDGNGPYTGLSDGRIVKWNGEKWEEFAIPSLFSHRKLCDGSKDPNFEPVCGRPLGLKFNKKTCELYIADAYFGLLVVKPKGGAAKRLAMSAERVPFKLTNGIDVDSNTGMVYFTDSSTVFQRRDVDFLVNTTSDKSGRFLRYNPHTKKVSVLHKGLSFPNGVALSANGSFVLVAESNKRRIWKFNLGTENEKPTREIFADLDEIPDNIQRNDKGEFWTSIGVKYSEDGKLLKAFERNRSNNDENNFSVSEFHEFKNKLYVGSVTNSYVDILDAN